MTSSLVAQASRTGNVRGAMRLALLASPAVVIFLSNNIANAGNLAYNMIFSRLLGPELFGVLAILLTLKLTVLALLNALQMAVAQTISRQETAARPAALVWLDRRLFGGGLLVALALVPLALSGALSERLGLPPQAASAFAILLLALPVTAPLCLGRGEAMGRLQTGSIVASSQFEMAVRFLGGVVAWQAGWGLPGIAMAMALSILAGWLPVRKVFAGTDEGVADRGAVLALIRLALPFAALQAAQVALMDGDILAAGLLLDPRETGLVAVLGLFQRIQFFACFGLAAVLLPAVTAAAARGETGLGELRPIVALFLATMVPLLALMHLVPERLILLVAGPAFAEAAPVLLATGIAAAAFTASYLAATLLAAWSDRRGLALIVCAVPVQFGSYAALSYLLPGFDLGHLVVAKAVVQAGLAIALLGLVAHRLRHGIAISTFRP